MARSLRIAQTTFRCSAKTLINGIRRQPNPPLQLRKAISASLFLNRPYVSTPSPLNANILRILRTEIEYQSESAPPHQVGLFLVISSNLALSVWLPGKCSNSFILIHLFQWVSASAPFLSVVIFDIVILDDILILRWDSNVIASYEIQFICGGRSARREVDYNETQIWRY